MVNSSFRAPDFRPGTEGRAWYGKAGWEATHNVLTLDIDAQD